MTEQPKGYYRLEDEQGKPFMWNGKTDRIPGCPMTKKEAADFVVMQLDASSGRVISAVPCDPPETT